MPNLLIEIRQRLAATSPPPWRVEVDSTGRKHIQTGNGNGSIRLFASRDLKPASDSDLEFIALARNVLPRLVDALDGQATSFKPQELDEILRVVGKATTGPWRSFIEELQPIGGDSMISIGGDDEPDMYLWHFDKIAPAGDIDFVAHARQDVPSLVDALVSRLSEGNNK